METGGRYDEVAFCIKCHTAGFVRSKGGGRPTLRRKILKHWELCKGYKGKHLLSVRVDPESHELVLLVASKSATS